MNSKGYIDYIGCPCNVDMLVQHVDNLNLKVVEQLNSSQELVMLNSYVIETNERLFLNSLKERVSEIGSWHWVLQDLFKRMDDAIVALKYESNAVNVVIQRLKDEIKERTLEGCRPGALCPRSDSVEEAITQEYHYLKCQKKKFEEMSHEIEKQIQFLEKVKKRIQNDILLKKEALAIDEECGKISDVKTQSDFKKKKKKKRTPLEKWLNNCEKLKGSGLNALRNAVAIRQQIRGARVQLSIGAQNCGARVDALLRKRLHVNTTKLEEISFQANEAQRDLKSLDEELAATDKSIFETMEQEKVVLKRMEERAQRPSGELTRDDVDATLKAELASLRHFGKQLRDNILRINRLQQQIKNAVSRLDDYAHDIVEVMHLDQHRIQARMDEQNQPPPEKSTGVMTDSILEEPPEKPAMRSTQHATKPAHEREISELTLEFTSISQSPIPSTRGLLDSIREEEEDELNAEEELNAEDDYPFDF